MKKLIIILLIINCQLSIVNCQSLSPSVFTTCGNYSTGSGVSLSSTMGETFNATLQNGSTILTQGEQQPELEILTGALAASSFCIGKSITVNYTTKGYFGAANVFTAQLSDGSGSFASPVNIGTLASQTGGNINVIIPLTPPTAAGYRIRVVSSVPAYKGKDNGANLLISNLSINSTASLTTINCKGGNTGAIDLTPSGGSSYSFLWNNGTVTEDRTNLVAGAYYVTITDVSTCTKTASYSVTEPATSMVLNAAKTNVRCGNNCNATIDITPTGGSGPYTYIWNSGATTASRTGLCVGSYTVTVTDANNCQKPKTISITGNPAIIVLLTPTATTMATSVTGGVPPLTYLWNTSPAQTNATATGLLPSTNYKVKVTDSKNCTKLVQASTLSSPPPRLMASNANTQINVYPNPTNGIVTLSVSNCINCQSTVTLYDLIGNVVYNNILKIENNTTLDFSHLAKGVYTMQVKYDGKNEMVKVMIQ